MNLVKNFSCFLFLLCGALYGQERLNSQLTGSETKELLSIITRSSDADSVLIKLEITNGIYDPAKENLPYILLSKSTAYDQSATAQLLVKKAVVVCERHARIIRKTFFKHLTNNFEVLAQASLSRNENLNSHKLVPFRINALNQVEELIDYEVNWHISSNNNKQTRAAVSAFKQQSVLASGAWYKIGVTKDGLHRINKTFLSNLGINTDELDPRNIRIYGNGGKMVPEKNKTPRVDDLHENPILVAGESDLKFDNNDYILFYATGTAEWTKANPKFGLKYSVQKSHYSDTSFYFINVDLGPGKRIITQSSRNESPNATTSTYDYYNFHEENIINFGKTGREFYGEYIDINDSYTFRWNDGEFILNDTIMVQAIILGLHTDSAKFGITGNNVSFQTAVPGIPQNTDYADYAKIDSAWQKSLNNNSAEIAITVSRLTPRSTGWVDKITVNARRNISVNNKQFLFRDSRITGPGRICRYTINNPAVNNLNIWNITDPLNPYIQEFSTAGTTVEFTASSDSLNEYCIVPPNDIHTPVFVGKVPNQNLHAFEKAQYVIITHPMFLKEAHRLGAFHYKMEGITYTIATTDQIYNEFGSGKQDISAIRDFIRMLYSRNITNGEDVKYVLLFGDGSYLNKTRSLVNNSNFIPTYQSYNTLSSTQSIATDDFYGLMDPDEGYHAEDIGDIDIGVGRFTCKTPTEARTIIDKIEHYYSRDPNFQSNISTPSNCNNMNESPLGDWRNWLMFLADDGDFALHMDDSDALTDIVKKTDSSYSIDKIFLDAYQRISTPGGSRYPGAAEDFLKRMKKGALIFNYTGHGGEVGLTAERLIDLNIINNLDNYNKLTLFITATCEFARYDDPARTSAGELCLLNPKGGAIALMTTSRLAYSSANMALNSLLLDIMFSRLPGGKRPTLGDIIYLTKKGLKQQNPAWAIFHLLGDPALTLSYPENKVVTSSINGVALTPTSSDTMSALSKITVTGFVADTAGNKLTGFNGLVYPTVFDKEQKVTGLLNSIDSEWGEDSRKPFEFYLQKNMLYRGKTRVTNGDFSFTFLVPKDISFVPGRGKISYYATNGLTDANGIFTRIVVGGDSKNTITDNDGPQVNLFLNDQNFVPGGLTNEKPVFYADLTDSSGINTVGTGLGHDISVILDEESTKPIILNDFYEANLDSYQSGRVRYPFDELSVGEHRISFKVWDILNNSNMVYTNFIVAESAELALKQVLNYPNPFTTSTKFMFQHNQACNPLNVTIQVYTISGKIVKTIRQSILCEGYRPEGINWDGRDDYGDKLGRGVYIYKLSILDINNKKAEKIEKLVILN